MLRLLKCGIGRLVTRFCLYNALQNGNIFFFFLSKWKHLNADTLLRTGKHLHHFIPS